MINEALITEFVTKVKTTPTITLAQYNTWLGTKQWYDAATIRYFVKRLADGLALHHGVVLANYTEITVLGKVRDWIVATPARKLEKVIFNR